MQRLGIALILVATGLWTGCVKDDLDPGTIPSDSTICRLLLISSKIPTHPEFDYTVSFIYDGLGRLDSTRVTWVDVHTAIKYHYSVDDHPDSVSVSFTYPPNMVGSGYRTYFGYDGDRNQILTARAYGDSTHYAYNSHGQLIRMVHDYMLSGVQKHDTVLYFYPNLATHNFNRATIVYHPGGFDGDTTRYTYDNHPIPLKIPLGAPFPTAYQVQTDNNLLKARSACCGIEYAYTYNSAGYPIEAVAMPGAFAKTTYTYQCETLP